MTDDVNEILEKHTNNGDLLRLGNDINSITVPRGHGLKGTWQYDFALPKMTQSAINEYGKIESVRRISRLAFPLEKLVNEEFNF